MDSKRVTKPPAVRRRRAEAFKQGLVERSLLPGASVAAIAQEAGVNANLLFNWRRLHLQAQEPPPAEVPTPVLLPVTVVEATPAAPPPPASAPLPAPRPSSAGAGTIEIDIHGARVRVRDPVDEVSLRTVLRVLAGAT
jgi:transposase